MYLTFILGAILGVMIQIGYAKDAQNGCDVAGQWRTQMHGAKVRVADCGDGSPCASLAWVSPSVSGGASADERNPNPALRSRPLLGLPIFWGFRCKSGVLEDGRVYNPDTGQTFRSTIRRASVDKLAVTGCLGPFCLTETWTRVEAQ